MNKWNNFEESLDAVGVRKEVVAVIGRDEERFDLATIKNLWRKMDIYEKDVCLSLLMNGYQEERPEGWVITMDDFQKEGTALKNLKAFEEQLKTKYSNQ